MPEIDITPNLTPATPVAPVAPAAPVTPAPPAPTPDTSARDSFEAALAGVLNARTSTSVDVTPAVTPAPADTPVKPTPDATPAKPASTDAPADDVDDERPRKSSQWREVNRARAEAEAERDTLKKRIDAWTRGEDLPEDLARLKKEHGELDTLLKAIALERHPRFSAQFDSRRKATLDIVKSAAGDKADTFIGILNMPPSDVRRRMLDDALQDAGPTLSGVVVGAWVELDRLNAERDATLARSGEVWKEHEASQQRAAAQATDARRAAFDTTLARFQSKGLDTLFKTDDPAIKKALDDSLAVARGVYMGEADPASAASHSVWGALAPSLLQDLKATRAEVTSLKAELAKLQAAQPGDGNVIVRARDGTDVLNGLSGEDALRVALSQVMPVR